VVAEVDEGAQAALNHFHVLLLVLQRLQHNGNGRTLIVRKAGQDRNQCIRLRSCGLVHIGPGSR
jgi:hypothetical protein